MKIKRTVIFFKQGLRDEVFKALAVAALVESYWGILYPPLEPEDFSIN